MADRNPLVVSDARKSWLKRALGYGSDHLDPAEVQRIQAELVKSARMADLRRRSPRRGLKVRTEAFLPIQEGEPGSNALRAFRARTRALRRSQRHQPKHGRQYVTRSRA